MTMKSSQQAVDQPVMTEGGKIIMKRSVFFFLLLWTPIFCFAESLKIDKSEVSPGQEIKVTLAGNTGVNGAWIGVIPSDVPHGTESTNDAHDVDYQYLTKETVYTFHAPSKGGAYDFRLSGGGKELATVSFKVIQADYKAKLQLTKTTFLPGDNIAVTFEVAQPLPNGAWLGIIPSDIPHGSEQTNDEHDVDYQYVAGKTSGVCQFHAPGQSGSFDFRLNDSDSNGAEIASVTFSVGQIKNEGTLKLAKTSFLPGEQIELTFTASETLPGNAWVGMIPSKVEHGKEAVNDQNDIQYQYVEKKASGKMFFIAPPEPGSYDFRLNSTDDNGVEITSVTFNVGGTLNATGMATILEAQGKLALYGIQFDFNQATIKPESAEVLGQVAELLKTQPVLKLSIEGHTDNVGKSAYNLDLSRKRAASVKEYLVSKFQIDPARLATQGFGDSKPIAKNDTDAGRAQNRRVELVKQ